MERIRSLLVATLLATILGLFAAGNALAQDVSTSPAAAASVASTMQVPQPGSNVNWPGAGYGAVALFGNLLYFPAKLVYAILGTIVGGGTYLVTAGNTQAASTVWRSALGGDYVLTPQMVAGEQPINFSGPTQTPPAANADASAAPVSSNVQPIPPLPPPSSAPAAAPSISSATSQPMDAGTGPVHSKAELGSPKGSIE